MARRQLSTGDYTEDARLRLGAAVEAARIAAGYATRAIFVAKAGISVRSLKYVEQGNRSVGPKVLHPIARELPGWTPETPRIILEGGPIPPLPVATIPAPRRQLTDIDRKVVGIYVDLLEQGKSKAEAKRLASTVGKVLELDEEIDTLISVFEAEHTD